MPQPPVAIEALALKWMSGTATPEEEKQLFDWYNDNQDTIASVTDASLASEEGLQQRMLSRISEMADRPFTNPQILPMWHRLWFKTAAAIIIAVGIGSFFHYRQNIPPRNENTVTASSEKDMLPGTNTAVLTLSDGSKIMLDGAKSGKIGSQAKTDIIKTAGQVAYVSNEKAKEPVYNSVETPRKGQYHLILSDGTAVWLDAESSIRFPTAFAGAEREVDIRGQVYFEVAKNAHQPFRVNVIEKNMNVKVLGTHFVIMAYANEAAVKTTLLEGSVRVQTANAVAMLTPGQQAQVAQEGNVTLVQHANIEQVMAWKNGMFNLGTTSIEEIMRQVARWYDADIVYKGDISKLTFSGEVSRKKNLSELLQILTATGTVHFIIEGKKITVMSNM